MVRNLCLVLLLGAFFIPLRSDNFLSLDNYFLFLEKRKNNSLKSSEEKELPVEEKEELPKEYVSVKKSELEALQAPLKKSNAQAKQYIYEVSCPVVSCFYQGRRLFCFLLASGGLVSLLRKKV